MRVEDMRKEDVEKIIDILELLHLNISSPHSIAVQFQIKVGSTKFFSRLRVFL